MNTPLQNIRIVLVGTLYSGNVGSVCRAMANMGISDLVLAAPRICDNWEEAVRMAVHADDILANLRKVETFEESVADCSWVIGTTARGGLYRQHVKTPRELAPELLKLAAHGRVALVFGREDKGLNNDEIGMCTHPSACPSILIMYPSTCHRPYCSAAMNSTAHSAPTNHLLKNLSLLPQHKSSSCSRNGVPCS
jgi:tRNA (cytidine32/uridine32-2'-O)-methyltransferase